MYRTSGAMTSTIKSSITRPLCVCIAPWLLVQWPGQPHHPVHALESPLSPLPRKQWPPTPELIEFYLHQYLINGQFLNCFQWKLWGTLIYWTQTFLFSPSRLHKSNYNAMREFGFVLFALYWLSSGQIRAVSHAAVVQKLLCNDGEIQTQHRWNNGYVRPCAEKQDRVIHQGRASVWVYTECVETGRRSREETSAAEEFLRVHGSRPKAARGYSAILTPHRLSYRPPSQPDTNRPSDLYAQPLIMIKPVKRQRRV